MSPRRPRRSPPWRPRTIATRPRPWRRMRDDSRSWRGPTGGTRSLLAANGFIDFGDQVALALRLVRDSAAARTAIAGRFRYILVDEFQDTNRAQAELVTRLAEPHRNVTVVGDDDQAIYAFRGAAVDNILDFEARYPGARTVVLRRNYRSLAPILDASYRLVRFNDPDRLEVRTGIVKRLKAERRSPDAAAVRLEAFATGSEEADWIAADIARRVATGAPPRDHAVLVRANGHADPVLRALNVAGIPWRFSGSSGLYARPEVRLLMAFLRVVADPESSVDLYALASSEVYGLGGEDLTAIVNTRAAAEPVGVGRPGRAGAPARDPAGLAGHPPGRRTGWSGTSGATRPWPTTGRPARCSTRSCATAGRWRGSLRRQPRPRRRASATSPASSTSSGPSRRCLPTTARCSWRGISRRSSTPATTRRPRTWTPTPTPWPSSRSTRPRAWSSRSCICRAWSPAGSRATVGERRCPCRPVSAGATPSPRNGRSPRSDGCATWR